MSGSGSTLRILDAELAAVVIPEGELVQVTLKVLLAAVVIHTRHAALDDAEEAFDAVRGHVATGVFLGGVVHRLVLRELDAHRREGGFHPCADGSCGPQTSPRRRGRWRRSRAL